MPDVSSIQLPDGSVFDFKDTYARDSSFSLYPGVSIEQNTNLNDFKTPGNYYCETAGIAATVTNAPWTNRAFKLVVTQVVPTVIRVFQLAIPNMVQTNVSPIMAYRYFNGSTWSNWVNIRDADTVNSHTVMSDVPANAVFTDTTYTPASEAPLMDHTTAAVGTSEKYAREDHVHPRDSKVLSLIEPETTIPSSANLNTYYAAGTYLCESSTIAETLLNAPLTDSGFELIVIRTSSASVKGYQIVLSTESISNNATIYFRYYQSTKLWSKWFDIRNPDTVNSHTVESDVPADVAWDYIDGVRRTKLEFVNGNISSTSGGNSTANQSARLRTNLYYTIKPDYGFAINVPSGYRVYTYLYSDASSAGFIKNYSWRTGYVNFAPGDIGSATYVRFVLSNLESTAISPTEITDMYITDYLNADPDVYRIGDTYTPSGGIVLSAYKTDSSSTTGLLSFSFTLPKRIGGMISTVTVDSLKIRVCRSSGYLTGYSATAGTDVTGSDYTVTASIRADNIVSVNVSHSDFATLSAGEALTVYAASASFTFS